MSKIIQFKGLNSKVYPKIYNRFFKMVQTIDQPIPSYGDYKVNFQNVELNRGNCFQNISEGIKVIKDDVHIVKITFCAWIEAFDNCYSWYRLKKNENVVCHAMAEKNGWNTINITSVIKVSKGDIIQPYIYFNIASANNKIRGGTYPGSTYILIEVIE